jgi:O-antigen ligase
MVFFRPQDEIPTLQFLHLAEMCAIGGLTALMMGRLSRNLPVSRITPELVGIFALGLLIILLAPFSIWMGGAIGVFKDLYMKVMLIFLLMVNVLTSPKRIERLTWLVVVASGYIGFRAVLDYARGVNLVENGRVKGAISGIFGNPNDLAMNMVSVLPLALFIAMRPGRTGRRLFGLLAALFMLGAIVATHSRSGAVGLAAMAIVLVSFAIRTRPGLVFGSALLLVLAMPLAPASYWERIASITDASKDETGSREARKNLLRESTQAFLENPLTGVGAGQFKNWNPQGRVEPWREAHDVFLQVGSELGIGGLTLFVFLIARAGLSVVGTRRLLRRIRHGSKTARGNRKASVAVVTDLEPEDLELLDAHSAAMAASLAGWLICALFASVAYNWTFYYLLALAAGPYRILSDCVSPAGRPVPRLAQPRLEAAQA